MKTSGTSLACNPDILCENKAIWDMHGREGVHCIEVRRSKSENTLCRLLITIYMAKETF